MENDRMHVTAIIASLDGSTLLRDEIDGDAADAIALGRMLDNGGRKILDEIL